MTPDLAALDRLVADAFAAALARASAKADDIRKAQRMWVGGRKECFEVRDGERPDAESAAACLRRDYGKRLSRLADIAAVLPASVRKREIKWSDEAHHVEVDIAYPSMAQASPGAAAFDAFFERKARTFEDRARRLAADPDVVENAKYGGMPTSLDVSFEIPLATPRVVTVVFSGNEYPTGAAHALPFQDAVSFDLQLGRPLAERDWFVPGGKERALALVLRAVRGYAEVEPGDLPATIAKAAGDLSAWTFRPEAVVVTLPVYSIVGYAAGDTPIWLTYDELRSMLRADAPLPPR
ncbi:MAG TPA: hypothetical protein VLS93_13710 [Anaeromyxobacteraceae bacterium]|nr:hypothetical protein [Anaeromyxobacteraceae bacterium]